LGYTGSNSNAYIVRVFMIFLRSAEQVRGKYARPWLPPSHPFHYINNPITCCYIVWYAERFLD